SSAVFMSFMFFFFSSRRRHTRFKCDWSSDVCSSDLAGDFLMGAPDAEEDERPVHRVYVSEFSIGRFTVTNDDYAQFIRATGYPEIGRASCRERVWRSVCGGSS